MRNAPKETVDAWLRTPALDPVRLVPGLLIGPARKDPLAPNHAIPRFQPLFPRSGAGPSSAQHSAPDINNAQGDAQAASSSNDGGIHPAEVADPWTNDDIDAFLNEDTPNEAMGPAIF